MCKNKVLNGWKPHKERVVNDWHKDKRKRKMSGHLINDGHLKKKMKNIISFSIGLLLFSSVNREHSQFVCHGMLWLVYLIIIINSSKWNKQTKPCIIILFQIYDLKSRHWTTHLPSPPPPHLTHFLNSYSSKLLFLHHNLNTVDTEYWIVMFT